MNQEAEKQILERFGIKGVRLDNLEEIYSPFNSGLPNMIDTRRYLIQKGMTGELADTLAKRYINKLESKGSHICSIMDLFDSCKDESKSLNALLNNRIQDVHLNYQTWNEYLQSVATSQVKDAMHKVSAIHGS